MSKKKFYITTAIDYSNAAPHIGHALEKVQADSIARYHRAKNETVFFLTGTDEHGVKNARAAKEAGKEPQIFVDENAEIFKALKNSLNLSWDDFIRTTDRERHWPAAQKLWVELHKKELLEKKVYKGLYCVGHEAFVTEKDLVNGKCADHQKEPEAIEEENWFFKLSKFSKQIEKIIESDELKILPGTRKNEILSLAKKGLEDVSFSRPRKDLSWGIPVPNDDSQTMYVWCDALTNYISAVGYAQDDKTFKNTWPADIHVIGKDILRFHAAIWPGMLLAAGLELPKAIYVHGFLSVDGQKISKTIGNVVNPGELVEKYGTDALRYYLLREIPSGEDGDFSKEKFEARYNGDLAHGIGNFASRTLTLGAQIGELSKQDLLNIDKNIMEKTEKTRSLVEEKINNFHLHEALATIWEFISLGDAYINETKPWKSKDKKTICTALSILESISELIKPFLPMSSEKIKSGFMLQGKVLTIRKIENLFPTVE